MPHDATGARRVSHRLVGVVIAVLTMLAVTPAATAGASAAPSPAPDQPTWAMPQNGDLLRGFVRNGYNEQDGAPRQAVAPDGRPGLQFELPGGAQRSEVEPGLPEQSEGTVQWYSYRSLLAADFPTAVNTWQVLLQWHQKGGNGSPPVAVEVRSNRLEIAAEGREYRDLGPIKGGDAITLRLRIAFSRDPAKSSIDVWRDGQQVLAGYRPTGATMLDDHDYLKVGYYRDRGIDRFGRFWLQDLRAGDTPEAVRTPEEIAAATPPAPSGTSSGLLWASGGLLALAVVLLVATGYARRRRRS